MDVSIERIVELCNNKDIGMIVAYDIFDEHIESFGTDLIVESYSDQSKYVLYRNLKTKKLIGFSSSHDATTIYGIVLYDIEYHVKFDNLLQLNSTIRCNERYPDEWFKTDSCKDKELVKWFKENATLIEQSYERTSDGQTAIFKIGNRLLGVYGDSHIYSWTMNSFHFYEVIAETKTIYKSVTK